MSLLTISGIVSRVRGLSPLDILKIAVCYFWYKKSVISILMWGADYQLLLDTEVC